MSHSYGQPPYNWMKVKWFINVYWNYSWKQRETMFEKIYI